ncbi:MAG: hypothetical protein U0T84_03525 [Chitinophagales bacterium]
MKNLLVFTSLFLAFGLQAQHAFYIGAKSGVAGNFVQYKNLPYTYYVNNLPYSSQAQLVSKGLTVPVQAELIYGYKKLRVGYQFEYLRTFNTAYTYRLSTFTIGLNDTTISTNTIRQNYFCHSLVLEYILVQTKHFNLVPGVSFGLFHGNSDATIEPFDQTVLKNKFKVGIGVNAEVVLGQVSILVTPQYNLIRLQNYGAANQSGFTHIIGLEAGIRVNCVRSENAAPKTNKKKKVVPVEEESE